MAPEFAAAYHDTSRRSAAIQAVNGRIVRDEDGLEYELAAEQDPWQGVCTSEAEYSRACALKAQRAAQHRADLGLVPEPEGHSPNMLRR